MEKNTGAKAERPTKEREGQRKAGPSIPAGKDTKAPPAVFLREYGADEVNPGKTVRQLHGGEGGAPHATEPPVKETPFLPSRSYFLFSSTIGGSIDLFVWSPLVA